MDLSIVKKFLLIIESEVVSRVCVQDTWRRSRTKGGVSLTPSTLKTSE